MARTTIRTEDITASEVTTAKMAVDPTNADNLASGSVPLARLGNAPETDVTGIQDDIALLAFKTQANGSLAKYNLVDQVADSFEDQTGIDTSASTNEIYDSKSWSGTIVGSYTTDAFTSVGADTWTCPANTSSIEVLAVAGGGGGIGPFRGGGGGAGGIVHDTAYTTVPAVVYDLTVGNYGVVGTSGSDTTWNDNAEGSGVKYTAKGGGGGQGVSGGSGSGRTGTNYGSGGTSNQQSSGTPTGGTVTSYGNAGGGTPSEGGGTGGGGAGGTGNSTANSPLLPPGRNGAFGGDGGIGVEFSNFGAYGTDSSNTSGTPGSGSGKGWFGGGGGGAGYTHVSPSTYDPFGGTGGGGYAAHYNPNREGAAGYANTGGGGGGGAHDGTSGHYGGTGIVLLRHRPLDYQNMTLISNAVTATAVPTKGDLVMTYTDGAGTNVLNTNIKGYVSRDGGTTYTQGTLVAQGTSGGHKIASFHDLSISGQPSGSSMRYKIETLVQASTLWAAIQAVSLGWS